MTRVLVFGTFDGLHEGHRSYLAQARNFGDTLIASVPSDTTVLALKGKTPKRTFEERKANLLSAKLVDEVILSDTESGSYSVLDRSNPNVIFLGYDQNDLQTSIEKALKKKSLILPVYRADPYQPGIYKSSLL